MQKHCTLSITVHLKNGIYSRYHHLSPRCFSIQMKCLCISLQQVMNCLQLSFDLSLVILCKSNCHLHLDFSCHYYVVRRRLARSYSWLQITRMHIVKCRLWNKSFIHNFSYENIVSFLPSSLLSLLPMSTVTVTILIIWM